MGIEVVATPITRVRRALATSGVASSFTAAAGLSTFTEPDVTSATRCILSRKDVSRADNTLIRVKPFGGNNDNETISVKAIGWNRIGAQFGGPKFQWESNIICQVAGTLSSALLGLTGGRVAATEFFCDALTLTYGTAVLYQGLADVDHAWFEFFSDGYEYVELLFAVGTADGSNALVSF